MERRRVLEGVLWVSMAPAIVIAATHLEIGELALGAFGPPPFITLTVWLAIGALVAAALAIRTRRRRFAVLASLAVLAASIDWYAHRAIVTRTVRFDGGDIAIGATVYEPRTPGAHPAMVLVHGSAPLKRGFYALWAERFAARGIVVVVPDKRGVGGTGGAFERENNTSRANLERLAADVDAALRWAASLPSVDARRLGLFGLSQAGWVAPMAALRSDRARFLVMVTAPAVSVREENVWSDLRGDDERRATYSARDAERIMDTVHVGGVDVRPRLQALRIPGLWLFGDADASVPTRRSRAVLDSLARSGKAFTAMQYASAGHLLMTRAGGIVPHVVPESWEHMAQWIRENASPTR